jgi:subtilisin family serine protease
MSDDQHTSGAIGTLLRLGRRLLGRSGRGKAHQGAPEARKAFHTEPSALALAEDHSWDNVATSLDPSLRLAVSLIETRDSIQLFERTNIDIGPTSKAEQFLPLHLDLNRTFDRETLQELTGLGLSIPEMYLDEAEHNPELRAVTARLRLGLAVRDGDATSLRERIAAIVADARVKRISLANPLQPSFIGDSLRDIDLPAGRQFGGMRLDGSGVVIGIVDDGCAFAHPDFMKPGANRSRVLYLWDQTDQSMSPKPGGKGWIVPPAGCTYGAELPNDPAGPGQAIDTAIALHILPNGAVDQDAVYADVGYEIGVLASHGTHVMGIAAGNGQSPMGIEGIAPNADIIFVQLPTAAIEEGPAALSLCIEDAVAYIFRRANQLGKSAVVNVSFGGYCGPHDGTSPLELAMDQELSQPNRAVVVAAGNGFEADIHAHARIRPGAKSQPRRWIVRPEDPTLNFMEIWYNGNTQLDLRITPPGAATALGPVHLGAPRFNITRTSDKRIIGWIDHLTDSVNNDNFIAITLRPTLDDSATLAPAPSGIWAIELENVGQHEASYHAWIERDDAGHARGARRRQSHFHPQDADARFTLASVATGLHTVAAGAYNSGTHEVCRYTACGPTRPIGQHGHHRQKPEVCAPAEEDVAGGGVLSSSSREARATRMSGTSASAPHVAGTIALMFQRVRSTTGAALTADRTREAIMRGALAGVLKPNAHQQADERRPLKQIAVLPELTGSGKVDILGALNHV